MSPDQNTKRTPEELRTLYTMHQSVRDVVVEGRRDRDFLRWILEQHGCSNVQVYAVQDRVHIESDLVLAAHGEVGEKGRVLGLARLAEEWDLDESSLTCVVDTDRDALYEDMPVYRHLLRTDVGSMDVYAFQRRPLGKLLMTGLGITMDADEVIQRLIPVLQELFLVRAALHEECQVQLVDGFITCCDLKFHPPSVQVEELVRRSLAKHGLGRTYQASVLETMERLRKRMPSDPLLAVRGHDIAPVLVASLGLKNDWAKTEVLERLLRGCLEMEDIRDYPLFEELLRRLS